MIPSSPQQLQTLIQKASQDQDILAVMLFGSHARGEARADSDVDICLMLAPAANPDKIGFDKRLLYMAEFNIDAHIYQQVPLYIRQRILQEGRILFCRDEQVLYEIACHTITEFADYEHIYRDYLKEVEHG